VSAVAELAAEREVHADQPAPIGHNEPPAERSPFDAVKANMDDYLLEARNWADGKPVETQAQADEISRLIEDLRLAGQAADVVRAEEKKPFDDKIDEIQTRYNAYIAGLKAKHNRPGLVTVAIDALKATLKVFLDAEDARQAAVAKAARLAQEAAEAEAVAALRAADPTDLGAREEAEELVTVAVQAAAVAKRAEAAKPQAHGGSRAMSLKRTYTARVDDPRALLLHYWSTNRDPITACLAAMAQADIDRHIHTIPGVFVVEGTKL
jgi:hypothetical protein